MKYTISRNPEQVKLLKQYNLRYAAMATCVDGSHELILDEEFDNAPKYVQKYIVAHEKGHILMKNALNDEYKADYWAVRKLGRKTCVKALWWMTRDAKNVFVAMELFDRMFFCLTGMKNFWFGINRWFVISK